MDVSSLIRFAILPLPCVILLCAVLRSEAQTKSLSGNRCGQ